MTREQITAMLDGLDGVTPGPWKAENWRVSERKNDSNPVAICNRSDLFRDAAHIARCDPDTIRALCELALRGLEVEALRAENERLQALVRTAYNEGFAEGMKEHTTSRGGNPWPMSKSRTALERKPE